MSGVLNVMVAGGNKASYSVTIANVGGVASTYGYNSGSVPSGAISPSLFRGLTLIDVSSKGGQYNFNLALNGVVAQTYFQYVMVQRTNGAWTQYSQQNVSAFTSGPANSIWTWGTGTDLAWTSTSPSPRAIYIVL